MSTPQARDCVMYFKYLTPTEAKATAGDAGMESTDGGELKGTPEHPFGSLCGPTYTSNIASEWLTLWEPLLIATPVPPQR